MHSDAQRLQPAPAVVPPPLARLILPPARHVMRDSVPGDLCFRGRLRPHTSQAKPIRPVLGIAGRPGRVARSGMPSYFMSAGCRSFRPRRLALVISSFLLPLFFPSRELS